MPKVLIELTFSDEKLADLHRMRGYCPMPEFLGSLIDLGHVLFRQRLDASFEEEAQRALEARTLAYEKYRNNNISVGIEAAKYRDDGARGQEEHRHAKHKEPDDKPTNEKG